MISLKEKLKILISKFIEENDKNSIELIDIDLIIFIMTLLLRNVKIITQIKNQNENLLMI